MSGRGRTEPRGHLTFSQINLQHCKAASALHARLLAVQQTDISLIQEPWVHAGEVLGFGGVQGSLFYCRNDLGPRACVYVQRRFPATKLNRFCSRDVVAVEVGLQQLEGLRSVVICSAYMPHDSACAPPPVELKRLTDYCREKKLELIIGCDANAQHAAWGSNKVNTRGSALLEFMATENLELLNRGSKPTFVTSRCQAVIDITMCNAEAAHLYTEWKVDSEDTLSDHRRICFSRGDIVKEDEGSSRRNPRTTDWALYAGALSEELGSGLNGETNRIPNERAIERETDFLTKAMMSSFEKACPLKRKRAGKEVAWWSKKLAKLRWSSRKLHNRAMRTRSASDWARYREEQREYKRLIKHSKNETWRKYCTEIEALPVVARLKKVFSRGPSQTLGEMALPGGGFTEDQAAILDHLIEVHFPDSTPVPQEEGKEKEGGRFRPWDWELAAKVVTLSRIKWAIGSFDRYKSPGPDGIFPALLQEGGEVLAGRLLKLFRASLAMRYIPGGWRKVRVVFIPKPGKCSYDNAKAFRPISLTSFLLKTLERLVDRYIKESVLSITPFHHSQHAYREGRSTETALHDLVSEIEDALSKKNSTLCVFIDIEGAFDNTSFETICSAARRFGITDTIVEWMMEMLSRREVSTSFGGTTAGARVGRGCPQGGVISPLMWLLVVDELLGGLAKLGFKAIGYADDVAIAISGDHLGELSSRMQKALDFVQNWCTSTGLRVNPGKTEMVLFSKRRKLRINPPSIFGTQLRFSNEVKYLGVWLDNKLSWGTHIEKQASKAKTTFWACRRMFGKTWGLKPNIVRWIYTAIISPQLTYASFVWWPAIRKGTGRKTLDGVFRLACLGITGALSTTPVSAMGALLKLTPPHVLAETTALRTAIRLCHMDYWNGGGRGHGSILDLDGTIKELSGLKGDVTVRTHHFIDRFKVIIPSRKEWDGDKQSLFPTGGLVWYTDGSKSENRAGAGVWSAGPEIEKSLRLDDHATALQAELAALRTCASLILDREDRDKHIYVCCDSKVALGLLRKSTGTSSLVSQCRSMFDQIAEHNWLRLLWVPGHTGIEGNEEAHRLAQKALGSPVVMDEGRIGISKSLIKHHLQAYVDTRLEELWRDAEGMRCTKALLKKPTTGLGEQLMRLTRQDLRSVVGIITGHWPTTAYKAQIGLEGPWKCPLCHLEKGDTLHAVTRCEGLDDVRFDIFGAQCLVSLDVGEEGVGRLLCFARKSGLTSLSFD